MGIHKIIFILIITGIGYSQQNVVIEEISVSGNKRISTEAVIRNTGIYEGMQIKSDELQHAVKYLWKLNRFNDIQILLSEENTDRISIEIQLDEAEILNSINFSGNNKIKDKYLLDIVDLEGGIILRYIIIFESL